MSHMNRTVYMPVALIQAFSKHTGLSWSSLEFEGAVCDAMAAAMQPQSQPKQVETPSDGSANGYQWKQVFLPEGTVLRASFGREPYYAVVEGSAIKYGEFRLSPSAFANLQGSGNRNAWKAVWLRFPGYKDWVRADECRAARLAVTARLFEPNPPTDAGEEEAAPAAPAGPYQQQYTDTPPSRAYGLSYFDLQKLFPDEDEKNAVGTASAARRTPTERHALSDTRARKPSWKGGNRKSLKRKAASRKRC